MRVPRRAPGGLTPGMRGPRRWPGGPRRPHGSPLVGGARSQYATRSPRHAQSNAVARGAGHLGAAQHCRRADWWCRASPMATVWPRAAATRRTRFATRVGPSVLVGRYLFGGVLATFDTSASLRSPRLRASLHLSHLVLVPRLSLPQLQNQVREAIGCTSLQSDFPRRVCATWVGTEAVCTGDWSVAGLDHAPVCPIRASPLPKPHE